VNKKVANNHISLRFRRWSRAGYAVFVSMTCAVTIGVLAVSVCEKSEVKSIAGSILKNEFAFLTAEEDESKGSEVLLKAIEIAIISVNQIDDAAARGRVKYFINQNG
jgi:hypothetical protein